MAPRVAVAIALIGAALVGAWSSRTVSAAPNIVGRQAFVPSEPTLILDLNARETAALVKVKNVALDVRGASGLPAKGATHVSVDVDIVGAVKAGRVLLAPAVSGRSVPTSSVAIPFARGPARKVPLLVPIGVGGRITVATNAQLSALRVSITGWLGPETAVKSGEEAVRGDPCRLLDTSTDVGGARGVVDQGTKVAFPVTGVAQVPASGSRTVTLAITASDAAKAAKIFASGGGTAMTFDLPARASRSALFAMAAPADAEVTLSLTGGSANVALDIVGYDPDGSGMESGGPCDGALSAGVAETGGTAASAGGPTAAPVTPAPTTRSAATNPPTTPPSTAATTTSSTTIPPTVITFPPNVIPGSTTTTQAPAATTTTQAATTTTTPSDGTTTTTTGPQGTTTTTSGGGGSGRATADRPDEVSGPQVHVVYVVAADGADQNLDSGTIQSSINNLQGWVNTQTAGRRIKMDTFGNGQLDVSFRRSTYSESFLTQKGAAQLYWLGVDLRTAGFIDTNKWYLIYYGGPSTADCFQAPHPPTWGGRFGALMLNGTRPGGGACSGYGSPGGLGYWEISLAHVFFHMLGVVPSCAARHTGNGHTNDTTDVMFGDKPGWLWQSAALDPGHDDYWGHTNTGCPDMANSIMLTPSPSAALSPPEGPDREPREGEGE